MASNTMPFLDRVGYCVIKRDDGKFYKLDGLDFKFSIERKAGAFQCFADVSVCGLKKDDVLAYTSFTAQWREFNKKKYIAIYAGYAGTGGPKLLFEGDVYNAVPTMPPDVWMNMKARTGHYLQQTSVSKSILSPMKLEDVCKNAANWMGKKLLWMVKNADANAKMIPQFQCKGTLAQLAQQMQDLAPDLICVNVNEKTGCVEIVDIDKIDYSAKMLTIDLDHGLLGVPVPSPWGVEFDMRLQTDICRFQPIHLESQMMPLLKGNYAVACYTHSGHLRGGDWKTHIKARRIDIYNHGK